MFSGKRFTLIILSLCFFTVTASLFGQNDVQFSIPSFNQFSINPAYAGMNDELDITALFRRQWAGLAESPTVQNVNAHIPMDLLRGGIGVNIYNQT